MTIHNESWITSLPPCSPKSRCCPTRSSHSIASSFSPWRRSKPCPHSRSPKEIDDEKSAKQINNKKSDRKNSRSPARRVSRIVASPQLSPHPPLSSGWLSFSFSTLTWVWDVLFFYFYKKKSLTHPAY